VNAVEQAQLAASGLPRVHVLGLAIDLRTSPNSFTKRRDILALGSLYSPETPNFDGLRWFIHEVWPEVHAKLGGARLLVAGFTAEGLDVATLLAGPGVVHLGFVDDPSELYNTARLFLAPTRFAAGIPFKVHEAAAFGLPVMATTLLAEQMGWESGTDLAASSPDDPKAFAKALIAAYGDARRWKAMREAALTRISAECSRAGFTRAIGDILQLPMVPAR
jgi:glycosyltransferase involved in cell wall biosynthesis